MGSGKSELCLGCSMSAQMRAEWSQTNKLWGAQARSCQHRPSRSCWGLGVGHTDEPARVPLRKPGAEATGGPLLPPRRLQVTSSPLGCGGCLCRQMLEGLCGVQDSFLKRPRGRRAEGCRQKGGDAEEQRGSTQVWGSSGMGCGREEGAQGKANAGTGIGVKLH